MPVASPPTHVPWFPDGDPLLPENQGNPIKPLLRAFDPYQKYDAILWQSTNRQRPQGQIYYSGGGTLADPLELISCEIFNGLTLEAILIERATADPAPWADQYVERIKDICDHFLSLAVDWIFPPLFFEIPKKITITPKSPTWLAWIEKDKDGSNFKRFLEVGTPTTIQLDGDILPCSVVISGEGEKEVKEQIWEQCAFLLFDNIDYFVASIQAWFVKGRALNSNQPDPFNREQYSDIYVRWDRRRVQIINEWDYEVDWVNSDDWQIRKKLEVFADQKTTVPLSLDYIGQSGAGAILSAALKSYVNQLPSALASAGVGDPDQYIREYFTTSLVCQVFSGSRNSYLNIYTPIGTNSASVPTDLWFGFARSDNQGVLQPVSNMGAINADNFFEFYTLSKDYSITKFDSIKVGDVVSLFEARAVLGCDRKLAGTLVNGVAKLSVLGYRCTDVCREKEIKYKGSRRKKPFDFFLEEKDVINIFDWYNLDESDYNFVALIRANNFNAPSLPDINIPFLHREPINNSGDDFRFFLCRSGRGNIPSTQRLPSIPLEIEANTIVNFSDSNDSDEEFEVGTFCQVNSDTYTDSRTTKTTYDEEQENEYIPSYPPQESDRVTDEEATVIIDTHYWEYEGDELKNIMVDSKRIDEIHAALDAGRYSKYFLSDGEEYGRLANIGFYIESMARILGINVMPDRSYYSPPLKEKVERDEEGNFNTPDSYQENRWGEEFEVPGESRVSNSSFASYGTQKNTLAYKILSKSFYEDPDSGEEDLIDKGGYYLVHNIPQLIQALLEDLNSAFSIEDLGASKLNIEKELRKIVNRQFFNKEEDDDEDFDPFEDFTDDDDEKEDDEERLTPKDIKTKGLLNLAVAYLSLPYARLGLHDYPVRTPKLLLREKEEDDYDPDEPEEGELPEFDENVETHHQNAARYWSWYLEQFDALIGQFPIEIDIEDNDLIKTGDQKLELRLPNLAETLAEIVGTNVTNQAYITALLSAVIKNLGETGSTRILGIKNNAILDAIQEYLGFDVDQNLENVPFSFNPIDSVETEEKIGDESLETALSPKDIKVDVIKNTDEDTLEGKLSILIEAARMYKGQNFQSINLNNDPKGQILELLKRGFDIVDNQEVSSEDFSQWLDKVESEFSNAPGKQNSEKPYGKDYDQRPRIREIGEQEDQ